MLRLRPFKETDSSYILNWIKNEEAFYKWSANRYKAYPPKPEDMIEMYEEASESGNFFPMTAIDDDGLVGHLILRYTDEKNKEVRFGFIIVDSEKRGKGYGKRMLQLAVKYAKKFLGAKRITLGVFENNPSAKFCYESVGFRETDFIEMFPVMGEEWKCIDMEIICHKYSYQHKVQYYETDKMGIVHHSNYIRWMEEARIDFLSNIGWDYKKLEDGGIMSPVIGVDCKYKVNTTFGDVIDIEVYVEEFKGVKLKIGYRMTKEGILVFEGHSEHCFLDTAGKILNIKKVNPDLFSILSEMVE